MTGSRRVMLATLAALSASAHAQAPAAPQNVVNLSASASVEVMQDVLSVTLSTTREGADATAVQTQLKQALDAALAEARRVAKPGQVDVQTGNFALFPRYTAKGQTSGWQGTTELTITGKDMAAIAALTGRIGTLTIARVSHGLSRELREKVEGDVAAEAIARFRAKAADYTKQFGYGSYTIREVNVSSADMGQPPPVAMNMRAAKAESDMALPVEAGKGTVTILVNGSVQMLK